MKKQLEQYFGCEVKIREYKNKLSLPIFMTMRDIAMVEIYGVNFAIVDVVREAELSVASMKKQKAKYEEALQCPVAYKVALNSVSMRNALVKNGVSFVDLPGNVFLPFMGIVLQDVYRKQLVKVDKMMPATQMVFLELLYMADEAFVPVLIKVDKGSFELFVVAGSAFVCGHVQIPPFWCLVYCNV